MSDVSLYERSPIAAIGSEPSSTQRQGLERAEQKSNCGNSRREDSIFSTSVITSLASLPYDILLHISQKLVLKDVLSLELTCKLLHEFIRSARSIWRYLAISMLNQCKPLRVDGFQRLWELDTARLAEAVVQGSWLQEDRPARCRKLQKQFTVVKTPSNEEVIWQSPITSKHILCCTKKGKVLCWDVRTGLCVTEWDAGDDWEIWKCRIEFDERVVYFAMARRETDDEPQRGTDCQLMALTFPVEVDDKLSGPPRFSYLSKFKFPGPVISVYLLDPPRRLLSAYIWLEETGTLGLYTLLDWTKPMYTFLDTGLTSKPQDLACIGYDPVNIVIHAEEKDAAHQYFYPFSLLRRLSSPKLPSYPPPLVSPSEVVTLPFIQNILAFDEYVSQSSHFVRQWWPSLPNAAIRRLSCTVILLVDRPFNSTERLYTLAQHYFSIPLRAEQLRRWYTAVPFEIVGIAQPEDDNGDAAAEQMQFVPMIAVDFGHAVWIERAEVGFPERRLRFVTFPHVDFERGSDFCAASVDVQTLETPVEIDLMMVCHIGLDQAQGTIILGLSDGTIYSMHHD